VPVAALNEPLMPFWVGEAQHVLAVGVIAGDLHRCGSEIGAVDVGDGDGRVERGGGLVLGVVQGCGRL